MVEDTELLCLLRSFNPWWTTGKVPEHLVPPVHRSVYYVLSSRLSQARWRRAFILEGPRRVGKTTLLYQLAADVLARGEFHPRRILYVSFDHPIAKLARFDQVARLFADVAGLSEMNATASPAALWLLDEIPYAADWAMWLKWLVGQHPHFRIVATGSATVHGVGLPKRLSRCRRCGLW